jgi:hypothetical protein
MNRFPLLIVAALASAAAGARADSASLSLNAGGFGVSVVADDQSGVAVVTTPRAAPAPAAARAPSAVEAPVPVFDADTDARAFVPDVYPSRHDAARAAAIRWAGVDRRRWDHLPDRVRVMSEDPSLFTPIAEGLRARVPNLRIEPCDGTLCRSEAAPATEAWLYVSLPKDAGVTVRSVGWSDHIASAKYVDKPWAANFADFCARTPGRWIVSRSDLDSPATTPGEAAEQARVSAAEQVAPLVSGRLPHRYDRGDVRRVVEQRLRGDRMVYDRFAQAYERGYGTLYREAVLVDASDARLEEMARDVRHAMDAEHHARVGGLAGAGAVLLVVYALYRLANAFTRGYFTWSLRTAAAVVAAGAVTMIVCIKG